VLLGQKLREIINDLQPRIVDELGLVAALQGYSHSSPKGIACRLIPDAKPVALPPAAANELFSICRDVIEFALVPNGVSEVTIQLEQTANLLRLFLRADEKSAGQESAASKALDDLAINERLFCLDGGVQVVHEPGQGLALILTVPVSGEAVSHAA
jgi:signal transduction histidine kinase